MFWKTQFLSSSISAYDNVFHLKFWGWSNWLPAILHTKFEVSSSPGTCFSKIQIWPKSAVNRVFVYRPGKCFKFFTFYIFSYAISILLRGVHIRNYVKSNKMPISLVFTPGKTLMKIFCKSRPYGTSTCVLGNPERCTICLIIVNGTCNKGEQFTS